MRFTTLIISCFSLAVVSTLPLAVDTSESLATREAVAAPLSDVGLTERAGADNTPNTPADEKKHDDNHAASNCGQGCKDSLSSYHSQASEDSKNSQASKTLKASKASKESKGGKKNGR
ncbi:hypothetical protein IFR05_005488 [Cadophora sp. M221]|nr:hypothetical protein IFR05_005488 [Cadophora sp. M221]